MQAIEPSAMEGEVFRDLPERVRAAAEAAPDAIALVEGDRRLPWGEMSAMMDRFAGHLARLGVAPGDVVASLAGVGVDHVLAYLGTLAAGAAFAPLPTKAGPDAVARMVANSGARLVLHDEEGAAAAGSLTEATPRALSDLVDAARDAAPAPVRPIAPTDLFDILYSSGTTGDPKGIEHDARFRDRQIQRLARFDFGPGSVLLVSTPIYSNTTLAALLPALGLGGRLVLMRKFDEAAFLKLAEGERATHAMLVPVQYRRLLDHPDFDGADLSAFQVKLSTSAQLPAALSREILDRWPGRMINIYGMTEGGVSAILDCGAHPDKLHTVGRTVAGAEIRILDDAGRALPHGEVGEIVGRSPTIMRGYRKAPEKTREALWISPEGETFIRSGDVGRLDAEGFLELLDRKRDMIVSGGFNIFSADLEAVLATHPAVGEAAVIAVPSDRWGETPLACVVPAPDTDIEAEALKDWTNARLGRMQRLSAVVFVDALPRNAIGKVLKRELRARVDAAPAEA